jgi:hypothetical protein
MRGPSTDPLYFVVMVNRPRVALPGGQIIEASQRGIVHLELDAREVIKDNLKDDVYGRVAYIHEIGRYGGQWRDVTRELIDQACDELREEAKELLDGRDEWRHDHERDYHKHEEILI